MRNSTFREMVRRIDTRTDNWLAGKHRKGDRRQCAWIDLLESRTLLSADSNASDYFPVNLGATWNYRLVERGHSAQESTTVSDDAADVDGNTTSEFDSSLNGDGGVDASEFFTSDANGIQLYQQQANGLNIDLGQITLLPASFSIGKRTSFVTDVSVDVGDGTLDGTLRGSFTPVGFVRDVEPAGTFTALRISGSFTYDASGDQGHVHGVDAETYDLVPGLGQVASTASVTASGEVNGSPANGKISSALHLESFSGVDYVAPPSGVDLSIDFGKVKLPSSFVSGNPRPLRVPVVITNVGTQTVGAGRRTDLSVSARPSDDSGDDLVYSNGSFSVAGLHPGKSRTLILPLRLGTDLGTGDYQLVASINASQSLGEVSYDNNTVLNSKTISVQQGVVDLALAVGRASLPASVPSGVARAISVPVTISNVGNVPVDDFSPIAVQIAARPSDAIDSSSDEVMNTITVKLGGLRAGGKRHLVIRGALPTDLFGGTYVIAVTVDPNQEILSDPNVANNTGVTSRSIEIV